MIEHESVDVDLDEQDVLRIRYLRIRNGFDNGGHLVVDRAHAAWLADELDAFVQDPGRRRARLTDGDDDLALYASGRPPSIYVMNARSATSGPDRAWTLALTAPYAERLAALLRDPEPRPALARTIRRWAERLCGVSSNAEPELTAALGAALAAPPEGVARIVLDERELGFGGVGLDIEDGGLGRADVEHLFGPGRPVPAAPQELILAHEVKVPRLLLRCAVLVRYESQSDDLVRHVTLRPEMHPPPTFVPSVPIDHESVEIDFDDPSVIRIRYERVQRGQDQGGQLVIDRANVAWLAGELYAFAQDVQRPTVRYRNGGDDFTLYGSGHEMSPYVNALNDRGAATEAAGDWGVVMSAPYAQRLGEMLRRQA